MKNCLATLTALIVISVAAPAFGQQYNEGDFGGGNGTQTTTTTPPAGDNGGQDHPDLRRMAVSPDLDQATRDWAKGELKKLGDQVDTAKTQAKAAKADAASARREIGSINRDLKKLADWKTKLDKAYGPDWLEKNAADVKSAADNAADVNDFIAAAIKAGYADGQQNFDGKKLIEALDKSGYLTVDDARNTYETRDHASETYAPKGAGDDKAPGWSTWFSVFAAVGVVVIVVLKFLKIW